NAVKTKGATKRKATNEISVSPKGSLIFASLASRDRSGAPRASPQKKQKPIRKSNNWLIALDTSSCCFCQSSTDRSSFSVDGYHHLPGHRLGSSNHPFT